jgi:hypothetical protein
MKLSEDIPVDVCRNLNLIYHGEEKLGEWIREIPKKWNVAILQINSPSNSKGIFTSLHVMREAFPGKNPLGIQMCDDNYHTDDKRVIYILYSEYVHEIKVVLPIACSLRGYYLDKNITPQMNLFLHYVDAKKETIIEFKNEINDLILNKNINAFKEIANLNPDILKKNLEKIREEESSNFYGYILHMFWIYIYIRLTSNPNSCPGSHLNDDLTEALSLGRELTYDLAGYLLVCFSNFRVKGMVDDNHNKPYCILSDALLHVRKDFFNHIKEPKTTRPPKTARLSINYLVLAFELALNDEILKELMPSINILEWASKDTYMWKKHSASK